MANWSFARKTERLLRSAGWHPERCVPFSASSIYADDSVRSKVARLSVAMRWESSQSKLGHDERTVELQGPSIADVVLQAFGNLTIQHNKHYVLAFQPNFDSGPITDPSCHQIHLEDVVIEVAVWAFLEKTLQCRMVPVAWTAGYDAKSIAIDEHGVVYEACWQKIFDLETVDCAIGRTADCIESFLNFELDPSDSTRSRSLAASPMWIANLTITTTD